MQNSLIMNIGKLNWQLICVALLAGGVGLALSVQLQLEHKRNHLPNFSLPELHTRALLDNSALPDSNFVLNFWASWCISCRDEHPLLVELQERGVPIVGVNYFDNDDRARRWLQALGDPYLFSLVDRSGHFEHTHLEIVVMPQTLFVEADGRIAYRRVGELRPEHVALGESAWQQ